MCDKNGYLKIWMIWMIIKFLTVIEFIFKFHIVHKIIVNSHKDNKSFEFLKLKNEIETKNQRKWIERRIDVTNWHAESEFIMKFTGKGVKNLHTTSHTHIHTLLHSIYHPHTHTRRL